MAIVKATKGQLSIPETGEVVPFMFNPNTISDAKGITWASQGIPGVSHPVEQFASGGRRVITFELYLDGDRGRRYRRVTNANRTGKGDSIDVADEIAFYRSLVYPKSQAASNVSDVAPYTVLLTFGVMFQSVPCLVNKADPTITYFKPDLSPLRATISMELIEQVDSGQSRDDIYSAG